MTQFLILDVLKGSNEYLTVKQIRERMPTKPVKINTPLKSLVEFYGPKILVKRVKEGNQMVPAYKIKKGAKL